MDEVVKTGNDGDYHKQSKYFLLNNFQDLVILAFDGGCSVRFYSGLKSSRFCKRERMKCGRFRSLHLLFVLLLENRGS